MKQILVICLLSSCANINMQQIISSKDVKRIEIRNGTNNNYIPKQLSVTNRLQIDWLISEVNKLVPLDSDPGIKSNFGIYYMKIEMDDNTVKKFVVIYTTYNGVVIEGYNKSGTAMDQYYKNNQLEMAILRLFQPT